MIYNLDLRKTHLQFKENSSTITCTQLLVETIEYFNINNTDCYMLLLDASKAFDRIEYVRLFKLLRERNMCPIVLRLIIAMYVLQMMQVRWGEILSKQLCFISIIVIYK